MAQFVRLGTKFQDRVTNKYPIFDLQIFPPTRNFQPINL